ncbi:MAG: DUF2971 domain-containing protein, partial [Bacillota bacterium]
AKNISNVPSEVDRVDSLKELLVEQIIPSYFVNCWFMSEYESEAMWRLYSQNYDGIAIRSTIGKLKNSVEKTQDRIWLGKVDYIDYDRWQPPQVEFDKSLLWIEPFFWKRLSFSHEKELRALVDKGQQDMNGYKVDIDLSELINAVYLYPDSKDWYYELVKSTLIKYSYNDIMVKRSSIGERPWE